MTRMLRFLPLAGLFLYELGLSALRVAGLALSPRLDERLMPGFVDFPLTVTSDVEITLLANLITLTPGTLSVDVSADRRTLTIHVLNLDDPERLVASIREGFEAAILRAMR